MGSAVVAVIIVAACEGRPSPAVEPGEPLPGLTDEQLAQFLAGRAQFDRVFTPEEGLGPLFNENQCSACHTDPASGGTGGRRVLKATRFLSPDSCDRLEPRGENLRVQATPAAQAVGFTRERAPPEATEQAQFTPTPLFGMGLIEAIPDETILARADPGDADGDGISGRPGRTRDGGVGRFGRKAETATLAEFVDLALRFEMGLTTPAHPAEIGYEGRPLPPGLDPAPDPEIDATVLAQLVQFVRFLAPIAAADYGPAHRDSVERGERLFNGIGCGACHVRAMTTGRSPVAALDRTEVVLYSDLLLHDMGSEAAGVCGIGATPTEVRTEPLMGLRYRTSFLHHGKAANITAAILRHGGEAQAARDAFAGLGAAARLLLLTFLQSL